jgi:hypothetical protein
MSPNSYIAFNKSGLLCGYLGEAEHEDPCFIWTYSVFEDLINECITPSMYHYMAGHVADNFTKDHLWEIAGGDYWPGQLEADAVDAYFDEPICERIIMHEQELTNLKAAKLRAEGKESAAIDAMLEENKPFDHTSPIAKEYSDFMRGVIERERKKIDDLERQIHEEEQWRGGHEEGAEDDLGGPRYDPMDE